jgi:hypothetical protein
MSAEVHIVFSADTTSRPSISEGMRLEYEVCAPIPTPDLAHSVLDIVMGKQHQELGGTEMSIPPSILACRFDRQHNRPLVECQGE